MPGVFKSGGRDGKLSARYYGKVRLSPSMWGWSPAMVC